MKTLKNHTLLYDDQCPLCKAYTGAFIKSGMLDGNGRTLHREGIEAFSGKIDAARSCNEIALVNTQTGEAIYGLQSLLAILGYNVPYIKSIGNFKPVYGFLNTLYKFISFNRKVIAPSRTYREQTCVPTFHAGFRIAFIVLCGIFTSLVLNHYASRLQGLVQSSSLYREFAICFGQIVFQGLLLVAVRSRKTPVFDYLGNMMTVSLIGALLLLPAIGLSHIMVLSGYIYLGYFMLVVAFMLFMHARRVAYIGAPGWLSISWVVYRLLVLTIIL